ncbi:AAA family ATPase [Microbispora sp. NEAU-D428]|uniref:helix-turn-helix transcriptional regulator n=1 Tax=Microbispora sitophila TaxID=2771537 RepID=UPI0018667F57|nr:AAA family ATPase [Microbispora sitophila]MBE3014805.1 AAA family ATPase [Microbispora sitophila]
MLASASDDLWERDGERATLAEVIDAARSGTSRLVLAEGPGGMGKTALLAAAGTMAASAGLPVLRARGSDLERGFGFGIVRQLFEPALAVAGATQRDRWLQGPAHGATAVLGALGEGEAPVGDFAALHSLYWLTANMCGDSPRAIIIDDLHLADAASLRFLAYLLPRIEGLPIGIVLGARPGDPRTDQNLLAYITTDPAARVLRLRPLSPDASARVIRGVVGPADDAFCMACHELAGGNPLLLRELAVTAAAQAIPATADGASRLPAAAGTAIGRRVSLQLSTLGPEATALAYAAAILDDGAKLAETAVVAGVDAAKAWDVHSSLVAADILRGGEPVCFVHPVVQAAVYDLIDRTERARLHRLAARVLAASGSTAQRVAAHLVRTPPAGDPEVVGALRAGAAEALTHAAPESALAYLERALQECSMDKEEQGDLLREAGGLAMLTDGRKAIDYLTRALETTEPAEARGVIADTLGRALFTVGRNRDAMTILDEAISRLGPGHADLRRRLQANLLNVTLSNVELHDVAEELVMELRDAPPQPGLGGHMLDALIGWYEGIALLDHERAFRCTGRAFGDGLFVEHAIATEAFADAVWTLISADQGDVLAILDAALAHSHRSGSTYGASAVLAFRALAWLRQGSLIEAEIDARESMRLAETVRLDVIRPLVASYLADTLMERGENEAAAQALSWAGEAGLPSSAAQMCWTEASRGRLLIREGRLEEGAEALVECGRRYESYGWRNPAYLDWRADAATALHTLGRETEAAELAAETVELARRWRAPRALGQALRVAGSLTGDEMGLAMLRDAVEILHPSPAQLEHAKALHALGAALRRANKRGEARACLAKALDLADRAGAVPLVQQTRAELRASGGRPRRTAITGPGALTPSERRVAVLAAAGHTNRVIAQRLFVTTKTVEVHLSSVYRKLGITRRYQLYKQDQLLAGAVATPSRG